MCVVCVMRAKDPSFNASAFHQQPWGLSDTLSASAGYKPSKNGIDAGIQITRANASWSPDLGSSATVSFGFRGSIPDYEVYYRDTNGNNVPKGLKTTFSPFDADMRNSVTLSLGLLSSVAGINFYEGQDVYPPGVMVKPTPFTTNASILLGSYLNGSDNSAGFAYLPKTKAISPASTEGDVWINMHQYDETYFNVGQYGFYTILHEIGHAIGLQHPGDYNAAPGVVNNYENSALYREDSRQYTIMSYFSETNTGANFRGYNPQTPLMDDIAALQRLYGTRQTRTDDTRYGYNISGDFDGPERKIFDFSVNFSPIICIYDTGGYDTIDLSGSFGRTVIDLEPGSFSDAFGLRKNISIAYGTIIESAVGGFSTDDIFGNGFSNVLNGGPGFDTLTGQGCSTLFTSLCRRG